MEKGLHGEGTTRRGDYMERGLHGEVKEVKWDTHGDVRGGYTRRGDTRKYARKQSADCFILFSD